MRTDIAFVTDGALRPHFTTRSRRSLWSCITFWAAWTCGTDWTDRASRPCRPRITDLSFQTARTIGARITLGSAGSDGTCWTVVPSGTLWSGWTGITAIAFQSGNTSLTSWPLRTGWSGVTLITFGSLNARRAFGADGTWITLIAFGSGKAYWSDFAAFACFALRALRTLRTSITLVTFRTLRSGRT